MMGQYLPDVSKKGVLKAWCVYRLYYWARSDARSNLYNVNGQFAFNSVGDAKSNAEGVAVDQTLEKKLGGEILSAIDSGNAFTSPNGVLYVPTSAENINLKE